MTLAKLFKSGYEGVISEVGLGVPLQSTILGTAGASNFLLMGLTPYNQAFQPKSGGRSVSEQMVVTMAQAAFRQAKSHGFPRPGKKLFALAISGTHTNTYNAGPESHAWICIVKENDIYLIHYVFSSTTRKSCIYRMGRIGLDLLKSALMDDKPYNFDSHAGGIDVIRWPNLTLEDKVCIVENGSLMVYFDAHGNMQRAADIVRQAKSIYRGSFNPPTNAHMSIGGDALFEISRSNRSKGRIDNLIHRIKMLNLLGKGVLVTDNLPKFVDLAKHLERRGGKKDIEYIMGADIFNRVCSDALGCPTDISRLKQMSLVVNNRDNLILDPMAKELNIRIIDRQNSFSSTLARAGDHSQIDPVVGDYIKANHVY